MDDPGADIDRLLAEASRRVVPPESLRARVRDRIDRSVRVRRGLTVAGGALAVCLSVIGVWFVVPRAAPDAGGVSVAHQDSAMTPAPTSVGSEGASPLAAGATVRMNDPAFFTSHVRSASPNVSIVRVYRDPTVESEPPGGQPQEPADSGPAQPSTQTETTTWQAEYGE